MHGARSAHTSAVLRAAVGRMFDAPSFTLPAFRHVSLGVHTDCKLPAVSRRRRVYKPTHASSSPRESHSAFNQSSRTAPHNRHNF